MMRGEGWGTGRQEIEEEYQLIFWTISMLGYCRNNFKKILKNVSTEYSKMFIVSFAEATTSTFCLQSVWSNTGLGA